MISAMHSEHSCSALAPDSFPFPTATETCQNQESNYHLSFLKAIEAILA